MTDSSQETSGAGTGADPVSDAQAQAAHAYAQVLLEPDVAHAAAQDAIAAFRPALVQRGDLGAQSPDADDTLLALTRLMTAVSVPDASLPADRRQAVWASIGANSHCTCRESAALLATRANGNIQPRESAALDDHLSGCAHCRELAIKTVAADRAFARALKPTGLRLPSPPRAVYVVLALFIAIGAGILAVNGGQSTRTVTRTAAITARPSPAQVPGQLVQAQVPTAPASFPPIHVVLTPNSARTEKQVQAAAQAARQQALARRASARKRAAAQELAASRAASSSADGTVSAEAPAASVASSSESESAIAPASASSSSVAPVSSSPATPSAPATAPSPAAAASPAPREPSPATAASSAATEPSTAAAVPSTASAVSGQRSLPAESAPQQGIGNLTTAQ
jgi:hypothetical protein